MPVETKTLKGMDSLLSIVQMPGGVPVGTLAIGTAGAKNAGLLAAQILALSDKALRDRLNKWRAAQTDAVAERPDMSVIRTGRIFHDSIKNHWDFRSRPIGPNDCNCCCADGYPRSYFCPGLQKTALLEKLHRPSHRQIMMMQMRWLPLASQ